LRDELRKGQGVASVECLQPTKDSSLGLSLGVFTWPREAKRTLEDIRQEDTCYFCQKLLRVGTLQIG